MGCNPSKTTGVADDQALQATAKELTSGLPAAVGKDVAAKPNPAQVPSEDSHALVALETITAAKLIQMKWKKTVRRVEAERAVFWKAWNELDRMEENEMISQHKYYVALRKEYAAALNKNDVPNLEMSGLFSPGQDNSADLFRKLNELSVIERIPLRIENLEKLVKAETLRAGLRNRSIGGQSELLKSAVPPPVLAQEGFKYANILPLAADEDFTLAHALQMVDIAKEGFSFSYELVVALLKRVWPALKNSPNVCEYDIQPNQRFTVVGDLHGQLWDILTIFRINGVPSMDKPYCFNGDFVDRGENSCEVILLIMAFKVLYPQHVFMNRGNHEAYDICRLDGFEKECTEKYDLSVFGLFCDIFATIPIALVIHKQVFVVHGGLAHRDFTLEELNDEDRFQVVPAEDGGLMRDLLWSDPGRTVGRKPNSRGAGVVFGPNVVKAFLKSENLRYMIRSHECVDGFQQFFGGRLLTIFSASNYCGDTGNRGGFITIGADGMPMVELYMAKVLTRKKIDRLLENNVLGKLIIRIANKRTDLEAYWKKECPDGTLLSRVQWHTGLRRVLDLDLPWIRFAKRLGLGDLRVGQKIDYEHFLLLFRPRNRGMNLSEKDALKEKVSALLFQRKFELEALFRHFDADGSGTISKGEMVNGIVSLLGVMGQTFSVESIKEMCDDIDLDGENGIDYDEFFQGFALAGVSLAPPPTEQKHAKVDTRAGGEGKDVLPAQELLAASQVSEEMPLLANTSVTQQHVNVHLPQGEVSDADFARKSTSAIGEH